MQKDTFINVRLDFLVCMLLVVAVLAAYWQIPSCGFVGFDDKLYVTENRQVQKGITVEGLAWAFTTFHGAGWHPLTWLSHMLDCQLYGLNPRGHHLTNLLLHIGNTLLLFFILQQMTGAFWQSAFVAALFALHPLHVESVAWVAERKDVLSTFFGILAIIAYYRYVKQKSIADYLLIFFFLCLGLMAKPMLVTWPFLLLLLDFWPLKRLHFSRSGTRQVESITGFDSKMFLDLILEKIPLFILVIASCIITLLVENVRSLDIFPLRVRIANALISYVKYIGKMIWPTKLAIMYPYPKMLPWWNIAGACLLLVAISFLAIRNIKKRPYFTVGWLWYLGTLVPVIGLVQVGHQAMADRYTYIPLIGLFIILVWGVSDILVESRYGNTVAVLSACTVLVSLIICTGFQLRYWKNGITLFEHVIKVTPKNLVAHNNLGIALLEKGRFEEAVFQFKEILKISPEDSDNLFNLGNAMRHLGNIDQSVFYFKKALKVNPEDAKVHNNLGNVLFVQGYINESIFHFEEVLRINPESSDTHNNLANVIAAQGKIHEAVIHYHEALRINPENRDAHYNLGSLLLRQKRYKEAGAHFTETIKIDPTYAKAYSKIGIILARQGKLKTADVFFSRALELDPGNNKAR